MHYIFSSKDCWKRLGWLVLSFWLVSQIDGSLLVTGVAKAAAGPTLSVNLSAGRQAINPGIYGVTFFWSSDGPTKAAQVAYANSLKLPLNRNGGDATTRYNWQVDSSNAGIDWFYTGGNGQTNPTPGASVDSFVDTNRGLGTKSVLTIPTIQYINKSSAWHCSFPKSVYGTQQSYNPYIHPNGDDCGNGVTTGGQNLTDSHITDHDVANAPAIQQSWVQHLKDKYGAGNIIYQLDNEPHNWGYMHRDVHPNAVTEDEIINQNIAYAAAIKATDPTAWVAGPSEIQFAWYFEFAPDPNQQNPTGQANTIQYLQAMKNYETQNGKRLIDSFDVHYPDANDNHYPNLTDIDRLKGVVDQYYPGTKISVSEWTGGDGLTGSLFTADELGIYGRDGLAFASYWGMNDLQSPSAYAYKLFRNYDGNGGQFGDTSVQATSSDSTKLTVYAAQRTGDKATTIMVINKSSSDLTSGLNLSGYNASASAKVYRYSGANLTGIVPQADQPVSAGGFSATYPANSVTMLVLPDPTVPPPVASYSASPIQSDNSFWVGAAKPNTTRQNAFVVKNVGQAGSTLNVSLPATPISGANAGRFAITNPADFPLALGAGISHSVGLSCTPTTYGPVTATLTLTTNHLNQPGTNFAYTLRCSGGYVVTVASDDGSTGTLSQVLGQQATGPGDAVVFDLPPASNNHITLGAGISLGVRPGVTVDGGCSGGPLITIDGSGVTGNGLTLAGQDSLNGLEIKGFGGQQLVAHSPGNRLSCMKVHKR